MTFGEFPHPQGDGLFTVRSKIRQYGFQAWVDYIKASGGFYDTECVRSCNGMMIWGDTPNIYTRCFIERDGIIVTPHPSIIATFVSTYLGLKPVNIRGKNCPDYITLKHHQCDLDGDVLEPYWWHRLKRHTVKQYARDIIHRFDRQGQSRCM